MVVRRAKIGDAEAIAEILVEGWKWAYTGIIPQEQIDARTFAVRLQKIRDGWDDEALRFVAEVEGRVAAFAYASDKAELPAYDAELNAIYVRPDATRLGAGRRLFYACGVALLTKGAGSLCVHSLADNAIGGGFYGKLGGKIVSEDSCWGVRAVWYGWEDLADLVARMGEAL